MTSDLLIPESVRNDAARMARALMDTSQIAPAEKANSMAVSILLSMYSQGRADSDALATERLAALGELLGLAADKLICEYDGCGNPQFTVEGRAAIDRGNRAYDGDVELLTARAEVERLAKAQAAIAKVAGQEAQP